MELLLELDREVFLSLNSLNTPWLDTVMPWITRTEFWIPLYLVLLYLVIREFRKDSWAVLLGIALTILIADQVTSQLMKPFFERLRPSHDPALSGLVHIVDGYRGGLYGFASGHAANTFGVATFLVGAMYQYRGMSWLFLWAGLMTYSRIYLGVHYPGDILVGALVGVVDALLMLRLTGFLLRKFGPQRSSPIELD
jgi:undecaprenyl-diphosphatase